jgi:hypothetical protein
MPDVSLVPVDHQPDFGGVSFVPVDHDPFSADGMIEQARTQLEGQPHRLATGAAPPAVSAPVADTPAVFGESYNRGSADTGAPSRAATENPTAAPISSTPPSFAWRTWGGIGAAMPEAHGANAPVRDLLARALISAATLPQRAIDASKEDVEHLGKDGYTPRSIGPAVETALMMMGGSSTVPAGANELRAGLKLPMDSASRMARAKQMGFRTDMPLYHGSGTEFSSPRAVSTNAAGMEPPGVSLALDPDLAGLFAENSVSKGAGQHNPQIYPLLHRAERPTSLTLDGSETHGEVVGALRDAFEAGYDAVMIKNYTAGGRVKPQSIIIVRDGNQLRSPNAAFDPARKFDPYLLAGVSGLSAVPVTLLGQASDNGSDGARP